MEEAEARDLLASLAPDLARLPLSRAVLGVEREVWHVGDDHVLRSASGTASRDRMRVERWVLERLSGRLPVETPRVLAVSSDESSDLCRKAPGEPMTWRQWGALSLAAKRAVCEPMGRIVAALHETVLASEARDLGVVDFGLPGLEHLSDRLADRLETALQRRLLARVVASASHLQELPMGQTILHDDLSHHNLAFDPATHAITGVFDFAGTAVGDPHRDLRYDPGLEIGDDAMVRAYEQARGVSVSRSRQRHWHALSALENLAWSLENEGEELQEVRRGWVRAVAAWSPDVFEETE